MNPTEGGSAEAPTFRARPRSGSTGASEQPGPAGPGPTTPERREIDFGVIGNIFRGAASSLRETLGKGLGERIRQDLPSDEAAGKLGEQLQQKLSRAVVFGHSLVDFLVLKPVGAAWQSKTEIGAGMAAGFVTKEAAKFAASFFLPGGILVRAGVGAAAGAATATAKEIVSSHRKYATFAKDLRQRVPDQTGMAEVALAKEFKNLVEKFNSTADAKQREPLSDEIRNLSIFIKNQEWATKGMDRASSKKMAIDAFLSAGSGELSQLPSEAQIQTRNYLESAKKVERGRLAKRALRGAVFGAAGGIAGGILVDWISSHLEATPAPGVAPAAATETATPEPATATPEPTTTPRPAPTATVEPQRPPLAAAPDTQPAAPPAPAEAGAPIQPPEAPAAPGAQPAAAPAPAETAATEPLPPTKAPTGAMVEGSTADNTLTYDGKPWVIVDNGVKNIGNLFKAVGESGYEVDQQALASKLQEATDMWAHGQLQYSSDPDLFRIFHLSNGTASVYNDLLNDDTLESLKKLGVVKK